MNNELNKTQKLLCYLIAKSGGKITDKVKLAKLQYFVDFINYAFNDKTISEETIVYDKQKFGPLSLTFNEDLKVLESQNILARTSQFTYECDKDYSSEFSIKEIKTIDFVLNKYGNLSYSELSDISHNQIPYQTAPKGGIIHLFTAYNLVDEYPDYEQYQN